MNKRVEKPRGHAELFGPAPPSPERTYGPVIVNVCLTGIVPTKAPRTLTSP